MELPIEVAEQIHRILREELPELSDPDVHRVAAKIVRLVSLCFAVYHRTTKEVFLGSKEATDDEWKTLVGQYFPASNQER